MSRNRHQSVEYVPCDKVGCTELRSPFAKTGMCERHRKAAYQRAYRGSDRVYNNDGVIVSPCSYIAAHRRVHRLRGKARDFLCAHGEEIHMAAEWAYNNVSPLEQTGVSPDGYPVRWSPDAADYIPLCKDHHYAYDRIERPAVHNYISMGLTVNGQEVLFNERANTFAMNDGKVPPTDAPLWITQGYCA